MWSRRLVRRVGRYLGDFVDPVDAGRPVRESVRAIDDEVGQAHSGVDQQTRFARAVGRQIEIAEMKMIAILPRIFQGSLGSVVHGVPRNHEWLIRLRLEIADERELATTKLDPDARGV